MGADEPVWLKHPTLPDGKPWACPVEALDGWRELGWEPTDERPVEVNPVTAEMPAAMFDPIPAPEQVAAKPTKSTAKADASEQGSD